jgi:protein TonB
LQGKKSQRITTFRRLTCLSILLLTVQVAVSAQSSTSQLQPAPAGNQPKPANTQTSTQTNTGNVQAAPIAVPVGGSNAEEVYKRIDRARSLAAAHKLGAAAQELESVRATTGDVVLHHGTSIMLMRIYLEDGNYTRAQSLLEESFQTRVVANNNSLRNYFALSGQAVNAVRQRQARYRSFGVDTASASLAPEATNDLDRLRLLLERMVAQAKEITREAPKGNDGLALLEDVLGVRASLARNAEDREKWQKEYSQAREQLAKMQLIKNAEVPSGRSVPNQTTPTVSVGASVPAALQNQNPMAPPAAPQNQDSKAPPAAPQNQDSKAPPAAPQNQDSKVPQVMYAGVLNQRASKRVVPVYPEGAKSSGASGIVKVHVIVDERGDVQITKSDGPALLKQAAEEAARGWRFMPARIDGKPIRMTGYIEFSFEL